MLPQTEESGQLDQPAQPGKIQPLTAAGWTAAILLFTGLTLLLTWPVAPNFTRAAPGISAADQYQNLWNFWWIKEALFHFDNPFKTGLLYYPYFGPARPLPLYFHTLQLFNGLLTLPVQLIGGVAAAFNAVVILAFAASGVGGFSLARRYTAFYPAAILAGLIYTFNALHWDSVTASFTNIMSTQYLPFYVLFLHLWTERERGGWKFLTGATLMLAACLYTDWYNTLNLAAYTLFYLLVRLGLHRRGREWWRQAGRASLPGLLGAVLGAPLVIPTLRSLSDPLFEPQLSLYNDLRASLTLDALINPLSTNGLLFWAVLLAGIFFVWRGNPARRRFSLYWVSLFLGSVILSLGPQLQLTDNHDVQPGGFPLPYALVKLLPGMAAFRAPERFMILAYLAGGLYLAVALSWLLLSRPEAAPGSETKKWGWPVLALLALSTGYLALSNNAPLYLNPIGPYKFVEVVKAEPGEFHMLELPITRHFQIDSIQMLNQVWHGQPIMGGYLSRPLKDPYRQFDSPYNWLAQQKYYPEDFKKEIFDQQLAFNVLGNLVRQDNYRWVLVYKELYTQPQELERIREIVINQFGLKALVQDNEQTLLFRVPDQPASPGLWLGDGFYGPEKNPQGNYRWTNRQADIYLVHAQPGRVRLSFNSLAFGGERTLKILLNGQQITARPLSGELQEITLDLDLPAGASQVRLESAQPATSPQSLGQGRDNRLLAFLVSNIRLS